MQIIFIFPQKSHKNVLLQPSFEYTALFIDCHKVFQRAESKILNIKIDVIKDTICWRKNFPLIWLCIYGTGNKAPCNTPVAVNMHYHIFSKLQAPFGN